MKQQLDNSEPGSLPQKLEAVRDYVRHLLKLARVLPETEENSQLLNSLARLGEIDFATLIDESETLMRVASSPSDLEKFRQEIDVREQKIYEFKMSLADSVIDLKNAQKASITAGEQSAALNAQVTQMQLHTKELALRLASATSSLEKRESELEVAHRELDELRSRSYQLKSQNVEYERHLKFSAEQVEQAEKEQKSAFAMREKAEKDLEHVMTSNREMKNSLENLEMRERELVETIDVLQKERNHLQNRLSSLLTGFNRTVSHSQSTGYATQNAVLEPAILNPYLPFCFPERLPAAIKFRREIDTSFPASYSRRVPKAPPVFISLAKPAYPGNEAIRSQNRPPRIKPTPKKELALAMLPSRPRRVLMPYQAAYSIDQLARVSVEFKQGQPARVVALKQIWWQKTAKLYGMNMKAAHNHAFAIISNSFDLYLQFLISTIVRQNDIPSESRLEHILNGNKKNRSVEKLDLAINFQETLAFRHRLQLKSTKLEAPGATLQQSFKRGNKLKSVLETFGNKISSIVNQLESIPNSRSDNGEKQ